MPDVRVKICGLKDAAMVRAACDAGAAYLGFVFFPKSPRNVSIEQAAALAVDVPIGVAKVALVVDADDTFLDDLTTKVPLDMLQLHGKETPERVEEIRQRYGLPVMKAIGISSPDDLPLIDIFSRVADQVLVEPKQPKNSDRPGGNGAAWDWKLVRRKYWTRPWMLAGGLTPENVASAIDVTGARQVDVSSGVESAPGVKDAELIRAFVEAAQK